MTVTKITIWNKPYNINSKTKDRYLHLLSYRTDNAKWRDTNIKRNYTPIYLWQHDKVYGVLDDNRFTQTKLPHKRWPNKGLPNRCWPNRFPKLLQPFPRNFPTKPQKPLTKNSQTFSILLDGNNKMCAVVYLWWLCEAVCSVERSTD